MKNLLRQVTNLRNNFHNNFHNNYGFTLIELLVVTTIIVILSAIGMVSFTNAGMGARDAKRKSDLETVRQAIVLYRSDGNGYPTATDYTALVSLLSSGTPKYLSLPTPTDPKPPAAYFYKVGSGTFCLCAGMEKASNANANGCISPNTNAYCVTNP
ncbi:MAG: type II secretion system protein [Pseudomonadales bacterium]|nr:type II secretion system protein [Pseudomonadales bacterium]